MHNESNWRPVALFLTVLGVIGRLLPHPPNFAPVGAASVFAGARLPVWQAYLVPLAIMAVTDPILDARYGISHSMWSRVLIYLSFMICVWIGRRVRSTESAWRIGSAMLASSVQFFALSNLPSWYAGYPHTAAGLVTCYVAALPFFERTIAGDVFFGAILFGLHGLLSRTVAGRERVVTA